jgi:hypothetical protein
MANLFVPLDVNYADDDKIIAAGPMGELLYVRSLAFVKRARTNGRFADSQLPIVAARIPRARHIAQHVIDLGLWERNGSGLYLSAWLKHNAAVADVAAAKADAGSRGAHVRWHLERRSPSPDCEHCIAEGLIEPMANG